MPEEWIPTRGRRPPLEEDVAELGEAAAVAAVYGICWAVFPAARMLEEGAWLGLLRRDSGGRAVSSRTLGKCSSIHGRAAEATEGAARAVGATAGAVRLTGGAMPRAAE